MKYLNIIFDTFGYQPDCKSFGEFVRNQKEISLLSSQL